MPRSRQITSLEAASLASEKRARLSLLPRAHVRERGEPSAVLLGAYAAADDLWTQSTVLL